MSTVQMFIWLIGWLTVWAFYFACGLGVWYYWRKGYVMPFIGCIIGVVCASIVLLSIGV